ncbi:MAG: adenine deaminase C-terminal domain-containing protein, partial [Lachnospiraceae bacterium]|nr:adenine deaminase C-terminal domain-containing protein [Lachnospiraceae bacterium]
MSIEAMKRCINANNGILEYDCIYHNVRVVNVFTETVCDMDVATLDGYFCALAPKNKKAKKYVDCHGKYMAPGLMDAHMHIETSHLNPNSWAEITLPHGTTGIFFDAMMSGSVYGKNYVEILNRMIEKIPTHVFYQIPSRVPSNLDLETTGGVIGVKEVKELIQDSNAVSLGEVNYISVLRSETEILEKIAAVKKENKIINGHCPQISKDDINTVAAVGVTDDHESMTYNELFNKLSRGLTVMIREGSIEPNVEELITGVIANNLPIDNLLFCTDDKYPVDLIEKGHMDYALNKAIHCGLNPIKAIKMATLNTAKYYHLDNRLGSITPGREADFFLFENLEEICPDQVYIGDILVADQGKTVYKVADNKEFMDHSIAFNELFEPEELQYKKFGPQVWCRVMEVHPNDLCPEEIHCELTVENGFIQPNVKDDILPIVVVNRYGQDRNIGKGFIKGLMVKEGAIASSLSSEGNNIVACGANYEDMALAINSLKDMDGGMVIVKDGIVLAENRMPIGGIMYNCSAKETIKQLGMVEDKLTEIHCENKKAFTYMCVATAPSIPSLGLT